MIYNNIIDLHGVSELECTADGVFSTMRLPTSVYESLGDQGKSQCKNCTGVEFRFVINSGDVKLKFKYPEDAKGEITVMHGDFVADWPETTKYLSGDCEITVIQDKNIEIMRRIAKEYGHRFSPDVVRLLFRGVRPQIVEVNGDIRIPTEDMLPKKIYLAYGSSITHGSIALHSYYHYVERVAANLGADVTNYGLAGSCCLEKEVADFIADKCEFDFATLEMGINILGMDPAEFERRVRYLVRRVATAHPNSKIFAIDVYYWGSDYTGTDKAANFREIVRRVVEELALPNVIYVNGKTVLTSPAGLSSGLCHPGPDGIFEMAQNLTEIIKKNI
ncbi:MAG: hypothetical protein IKU43_08140 [Clostridia bacterium]|nr:hypothetical protein [Clostridia bacterium]